MYQFQCSNSCPILELSVKFASQTCHENINKPLDGAYLVDFGIDIIGNNLVHEEASFRGCLGEPFNVDEK